MTDKQINAWLRRRFSPLGWLLVGYYVLMTLLSAIAMGAQALNQLRYGWNNMDPEALMTNGWGYLMAIAVAFLILHAWKGPGYWREQVLAREKKLRFGPLLIFLCLSVACQFVNSFWVAGLEGIANLSDKSFLPLLESVSGATDSVSMFLYASILAPISEELIFRGVILRALRPYGKKFAIFGSAFLFGLFHGNLLQTPYAFLMGLLLGYVTVEYSVLWAVAVHMFNNLVLADLLTRLTGLLPQMAADTVSVSLLGSCTVISCVILVKKRREIAAYVSREWMDRRVLKCFFFNSGILALTGLMLINILMMIP